MVVQLRILRVLSIYLSRSMRRLPMHPQRTTMIVIATLAIFGCFFPAGVVPAVGSMTHVIFLRKLAVGLLAVVWLLIAIGNSSEAMVWPLRMTGFVVTGLIVAICIGRLAVLGPGELRAFDDNDPRAGAYLQRACDAGRMRGCTRLAACYWDGNCGVEKDEGHGVALLQKGCDGGDMEACGQLGVCYEIGACGLLKNQQRAVALYERACEGGELGMCNNLGICFHKGQCGFARDEARAEGLYSKACKGGDVSACHNLDLMKR